MTKPITKLPNILSCENTQDSICIERALKQVLRLLEQAELSEEAEDARQASIDDVETMLNAIDRYI